MTQLADRIARMAAYVDALREAFDGADRRSYINQNTHAVRREVIESGCMQLFTLTPPPAIGGLVQHNIDPFNIIFEAPYGRSIIPNLIDMIEQAIGVMSEPGYGQPLEVSREGVVSEPVQRGYVFIAMPMAGNNPHMDDVHDAIKEVARQCGLTAERVDDTESNDRITDRLLESIRKAEFVVVDLTEERPNVFYEAGYAQGMGKTPIYIARQGTNLHFDLKDYPIIFFDNLRTLKTRLAGRLQALAGEREAG